MERTSPIDPVIILVLALDTLVQMLEDRTVLAWLFALALGGRPGRADQTGGAMEVSSFSVGLADGRSLEVSVSGPEAGTPLVLHHGTPSERTQYPPFAQAAAARGLQLVTYSRPGYGGSSRQASRAVADCAADTLAILQCRRHPRGLPGCPAGQGAQGLQAADRRVRGRRHGA
jgi:pimeloyl-ACP methyl ester carboxylesterase